jgi:hypothetical protein
MSDCIPSMGWVGVVWCGVVWCGAVFLAVVQFLRSAVLIVMSETNNLAFSKLVLYFLIAWCMGYTVHGEGCASWLEGM